MKQNLRGIVRGAADSLAVVIVGAACLIGISTAWKGLVPQRGRDLGRAIEAARIANTGHWLGSTDAAVVILVFNDYACGFCLQLHETLERIRLRYPDHVAVVIKPFVTGSPDSGPYKVALAAECASTQDRFGMFHDAAFQNRRVVQFAAGWRTIGLKAGIPDTTRFTDCVRSLWYVDQTERARAEGQRLGVVGTPTMFINGRKVEGAVGFDVLDSLVAEVLRRRHRPE